MTFQSQHRAALLGGSSDSDVFFENVEVLSSLGRVPDGEEDLSNNAFTINQTPGTVTKDVGNTLFSAPTLDFGGGDNGLTIPSFDAFTADYRLSTAQDYTIEVWVYPVTASPSTNQWLVSVYNAGSDDRFWALYLNSSGNTRFDFYTDKTDPFSAVRVEDSSQLTTSTWTHVAAQRKGTDLRLFVDGVSVDNLTTSDYTDNSGDNTELTVGIDEGSNPLYPFDGNLSELRITLGVARYNTAGFTPPTDIFPRS